VVFFLSETGGFRNFGVKQAKEPKSGNRGNGAEVAGEVGLLKNSPGGVECFAAQRRARALLPAAASVDKRVRVVVTKYHRN
jgi:hypothetical protein